MSCLAKLFDSLLNNRLVNYLKKHSVLSEFQIGFMKGYRTTDHIFVLRFLIDNYVKTCKKDIFAAFIDFSKAFDRIWRDALVLKLLQSGVRGRMIRIIENMYRTTEYGVKCQGGITPFFSSSLKATFHLTISMRGQRAAGKIQRNSYHHGTCGPSLTGKTLSLSLIFTHWTHRNVKNR